MSHESLNNLLRAFAATCRDLAEQPGPARPGFERVIAEIGGLGEPEPVRAQSFPQVERHLPAVTANPPPGARGDLLTALAAAAADLPWREARIYGDGPGLDGFYDGYAFCQVVGAPFADYRSPWNSARIRLGVTLQAPGVFYPAHAHLAQEIYVVIGGAGEWRQRGRPWTARRPDGVIFHDHHEPHAMRTTDEAMLAIFIWPGDVESYPVLTDHDWAE